MVERVLRGSRLGSLSYENERSQELAARQRISFECSGGHRFSRVFAEEAETVAEWECPRCGQVALAANATRPEPKKTKPVRTHWDMLMERRTTSDLEVLLAERLTEIRGVVGHRTKRKSA
jgi:ABC-type ATPase with predicted acetyltransferase domain